MTTILVGRKRPTFPDRCPKCGSGKYDMKYDKVLDAMALKCERCEYEWTAPTLDKQEASEDPQ